MTNLSEVVLTQEEKDYIHRSVNMDSKFIHATRVSQDLSTFLRKVPVWVVIREVEARQSPREKNPVHKPVGRSFSPGSTSSNLKRASRTRSNKKPSSGRIAYGVVKQFYPRHQEPWTESDIEIIKDESLSVEEKAELMERTMGATIQRMRKEGLDHLMTHGDGVKADRQLDEIEARMSGAS